MNSVGSAFSRKLKETTKQNKMIGLAAMQPAEYRSMKAGQENKITRNEAFPHDSTC